MNWTQPICSICYGIRIPGRTPTVVVNSQEEKCCDCGHPTREGIYYRVDPRTVKFPAEENS